MIVVVDASVAVKWVLPESDSDRAKSLRTPDDDLVAPSLIIAEIGNAIWKNVLRGDMEKGDAASALQIAIDHFAEIVPIETLGTRAMNIAIELRHPIYDCFYLALAERVHARIVSADSKLLMAAMQVKGINVQQL